MRTATATGHRAQCIGVGWSRRLLWGRDDEVSVCEHASTRSDTLRGTTQRDANFIPRFAAGQLRAAKQSSPLVRHEKPAVSVVMIPVVESST